MLRDLHIRNLAVLEEAAIEFGSGFNVLSGETGAGKSIVVDSLALLSGVRASSDLIRTDADALTVTGVFEPSGDGWRGVLATAGLEPDGDAPDMDGDASAVDIVIRREVRRNGRNRVYVNDRPVTLDLLTQLAPHLLRIHGQREELGLVDPELQRTWLDRCGGDEAQRLLAATAKAHAAWLEVARRLERLTGDERARHERLDFLRFQLAEIDDAAPQADEEIGLEEERNVLRHSDAIRQALSGACEVLFDRDGAAYEHLGRARTLLEGIEAWEGQAAEWSAELADLHIRLGELDQVLHRRLDTVDADPQRLDAIEARLATLERLFRKHGGSTRELLERRAAIVAEIDELGGDADTLEELKEASAAALDRYRKAAAKLTDGRRQWGDHLSEQVRGDLAELALAKARFSVRLDTRKRRDSPLQVDGEAVDFGPFGVDQVVFEFSPNPGEALRPLAKVASGGELSRLYLAVQLAGRAAGGEGTTLVFDEVDAGISGAEAATLGGKLARLAQGGGQVLAVTHLPQVASQGDHHFKVSKDVEDDRTRTQITSLADHGRVEEVARMLAGNEVTELSLSHARELIESAVGR